MESQTQRIIWTERDFKGHLANGPAFSQYFLSRTEWERQGTPNQYALNIYRVNYPRSITLKRPQTCIYKCGGI